MDQSLMNAGKDEYLQPQFEDAHMSDENKSVCRSLREAVSLRKKYLFLPSDEDHFNASKEVCYFLPLLPSPFVIERAPV